MIQGKLLSVSVFISSSILVLCKIPSFDQCFNPCFCPPQTPLPFSDPDKASLINSTFSSLFTTDPSPLINPLLLDPSLCPDDLLCSEEEVAQLISDLPSNTSCCLNGISSFILKSTALSISLPLQKPIPLLWPLPIYVEALHYCSHSKNFPSLIFL